MKIKTNRLSQRNVELNKAYYTETKLEEMLREEIIFDLEEYTGNYRDYRIELKDNDIIQMIVDDGMIRTVLFRDNKMYFIII